MAEASAYEIVGIGFPVTQDLFICLVSAFFLDADRLIVPGGKNPCDSLTSPHVPPFVKPKRPSSTYDSNNV